MNPKEIKVGETYNVRLQVSKKETYGIKAIAANAHDLTNPIEHLFEPREFPVFSPISPANGIKNAETAPKYDPCRLFKAGDIVEPCQVKGRWFGTAWKARRGIRFTVTKAEDEEGVMWVQDPDSLHPKDVEAVFFQLITPVEELEVYSVHENEYSKSVEVRRGHPVRACAAYYYGGEQPAYTKEQALARAAAECDRLNAEWRKEQDNAL